MLSPLKVKKGRTRLIAMASSNVDLFKLEKATPSQLATEFRTMVAESGYELDGDTMFEQQDNLLLRQVLLTISAYVRKKEK